MATTRTISVDAEQIESAKALIEISGGPEHVDPLIRKIAEAGSRPSSERARRP